MKHKILTLGSGTRQRGTLVPLLFNTVLEAPARAVNNKKASKLERKK